MKWQNFISECENLAEKLFFTGGKSEQIAGSYRHYKQKNSNDGNQNFHGMTGQKPGKGRSGVEVFV